MYKRASPQRTVWQPWQGLAQLRHYLLVVAAPSGLNHYPSVEAVSAELCHFSLGAAGVGRVRAAALSEYSSEQTRHSVVGGDWRQGSPMAVAQVS